MQFEAARSGTMVHTASPRLRLPDSHMDNSISMLSDTSNITTAKKMLPSTRKNGILANSSPSSSSPPSPPSPPHTLTKLTPPQTKTEGSHTQEVATDCPSNSERMRLLCPELAISYTSKLISNRSGQLGSKQKSLEDQLLQVQRKLQATQLETIHAHSLSQLERQRSGSRSKLSEAPSTPDLECVEAIENALSLQVDGSSEDVFLKPVERLSTPLAPPVVEEEHGEPTPPKPSEDVSFESSFQSEEGGEGVELVRTTLRLQQRLQTAQHQLDDGELTDCSSDEEHSSSTEEGARKLKREELKRNWEHSRASIGERWVWLERKISDINQQICRLDCQRQKQPSKEHFSFAKPDPPPPSCVAMPTMNGALISQLQRGNGSGLLGSLHKQDGISKALNGFKPHSGSVQSHSGSTQYLPQLLLPEGLMNAKLQVKDLLAPSPLGRNFSVIVRDEEVNNCARTRALEGRAQRRVVRMKQKRRRTRKGAESLDPCYHPHLSMPRELPSRVLLDAAVKRITEEHSYAQLPLIKRRKAASSLPHIRSSAPINRCDKSSFSSTPSPNAFYSEKASSAKLSRKKSYVAQLQSWGEALPTSPSPATTRPDTPTSATASHTPSSLVRKRKPTVSTPSFDIDNIVIPYSMAASTRLEKLDYKEIITPSWREVEKESTNRSSSAPPVSMETEAPVETKKRRTRQATHKPKPLTNHCTNERGGGKPVANGNVDHTHPSSPLTEDVSDTVFLARHLKCEIQEKKRFLNFISGGPPRKKSRPQSLASTPDTPGGQISNSSTPSGGGHNFQPPRRILSSPGPQSFIDGAGGVGGGEVFHRVVPPWTPRDFPLIGADFDALSRPIPPPRFTPSPLTLATPLSSPVVVGNGKTHLNHSNVATPLSSPVSTPSGEFPAISPTEWMVVNSIIKSPTAASSFSPGTFSPHSYSSSIINPPALPSSSSSSSSSSVAVGRSIVLKLHKKT